MDVNWFKQQQKLAGVTADQIADRIGRARSNVSHIYAGKQKMSLEWAKAFAETLNVPLSDVLEHAGITSAETAKKVTPGFSEGDAAAWAPSEDDKRQAPTIADALGARPGVDIWRVKTNAMALQGLLPGDYMLVDTYQAERAKTGDVVIAQIYDNAKNRATTVLRRLELPVLVAASMEPDDHRVHVVDGVNVVVRGKIVASWRNLGKPPMISNHDRLASRITMRNIDVG
jgi:SOS-response transcriptional repressor LexA